MSYKIDWKSVGTLSVLCSILYVVFSYLSGEMDVNWWIGLLFTAGFPFLMAGYWSVFPPKVVSRNHRLIKEALILLKKVDQQMLEFPNAFKGSVETLEDILNKKKDA